MSGARALADQTDADEAYSGDDSGTMTWNVFSTCSYTATNILDYRPQAGVSIRVNQQIRPRGAGPGSTREEIEGDAFHFSSNFGCRKGDSNASSERQRLVSLTMERPGSRIVRGCLRLKARVEFVVALAQLVHVVVEKQQLSDGRLPAVDVLKRNHLVRSGPGVENFYRDAHEPSRFFVDGGIELKRGWPSKDLNI